MVYLILDGSIHWGNTDKFTKYQLEYFCLM